MVGGRVGCEGVRAASGGCVLRRRRGNAPVGSATAGLGSGVTRPPLRLCPQNIMGSGSSDGTNPADDVRAPAKPVPHEEVEEGIDPFAEDTASEDEDHSSVPSGGRGATPRESQPAHAGPEPEPESLLEMREQITMLQAQLDALKGQVEVRVRGWEGGACRPIGSRCCPRTSRRSCGSDRRASLEVIEE